MKDIRIEKLAKLLVNYSLDIQKGEKFLISSSYVAMPLIKEVYKEALLKGAFPDVRIQSDELKEILLKNGTEEQLLFMTPIDKKTVDTYDVFLSIWGDENTKPFSNIDSSKITKNMEGKKDWRSNFFKKIATKEIKWCGTLFPTNASAQDASMSLEEYENFVYGAGLLNEENPIESWKAISKKQETISDYMNTKKVIRFVNKNGTDITLKVEGRKWINCDGRENFPDGEVFTTPIKDSANGVIRFTFPAIYGGKEVENVELTFKDGKAIKAIADKGEEHLNKILDTDENSRFLGEVAIATNYNVKNFSKNILFDEKIGGTIHLALGAGFEETGGNNESAIHWDMICDMRDGGQIFADNQLVYENGSFIVDFK
jgi:aminopeptidase